MTLPSASDKISIYTMNSTTKQDRSAMAAELGRLGGKAKFKKYGKKHMQEIGKRGATARWGTEPRTKNGKRTKPKRKG